jgi:hypothetical protein
MRLTSGKIGFCGNNTKEQPEIDPGDNECGEMWLPLPFGLSSWKLTLWPFVYGEGGGTGGGRRPEIKFKEETVIISNI